jgi:hypothetical protein
MKKSVFWLISFLNIEVFGPYLEWNSPLIPPTFWVEMVRGGKMPCCPRPTIGTCESDDDIDDNGDDDDDTWSEMLG